MTPREQEVLAVIRDDPSVSQAAIAAALGISRSAVAGHIMNLTAKGVIRGRRYVLSNAPFVAVVGGANMDICASSMGSLRLRDSNPGTVVTSPGGVARNIAENLARLGVDCRLIAAVGADHHGDMVLQQGRAAGIDMSAVLRLDDVPTSTYVSVLDDSGDMHVGVSDMSIVEKLRPDTLRPHEKMLREARLIVADTNLPNASLEYLCHAARGGRLFVDAVSAAKAPRVRPYLKSVHTLKAGSIEAEAISGLRCRTERELTKSARWFHEQGVQNVFVSLGEKGVFFSDGRELGLLPVPAAKRKVANANGAGDALFAGVIYGCLKQWPLTETTRFAMSVAGVTLAHRATINPDLSHALVQKHLAEVYA